MKPSPTTLPCSPNSPDRQSPREPSAIELLEARIAPAVVVVSAHLATYTDIDGDHVSIQVSKGDLHTVSFTTASMGLGEQLQVMDMSQGGFEAANLTFSVAKAKTGDGLANIGAIIATGQNLGVVTVPGDLGQIDVGANAPKIPALKALTVRSLGMYDLATQGGVGDLVSSINGSLGSLKVRTDVKGATINLSGGTSVKLGSVSIGGSLLGGSATNSGALISSGDIGPVQIGGDVVGDGFASGLIQSGGKLASLSIVGSLIGGSAPNSGEILSSSDMGPVKIGQDIQGGAGALSGAVSCSGKLASLTLGGSLIGGSKDVSGSVTAGGAIGSITIGGNLQGGFGFVSGTLRAASDVGSLRIGGSIMGGNGGSAGQVQLGGHVGSITIGGSILGGTEMMSGVLEISQSVGTVKIGHDLRGGSGLASGTIFATGDIANLSIGGSVVGGTSQATGSVRAGNIANLSVGGSLVGGSISGSDSLDGTGEIVGTHLGNVFIGGSIVSGTDDSTGTLTNNAGIRASQDIGSVVIAGNVVGNSTAAGDSPVVISAQGEAHPTAGHNSAIGSITIGGRVERALILGGYSTSVDAANTSLSFANSNAQIGSVMVGGDWIASSLVAGAVDNNQDGFGNADDSTGAGGAAVISKIASIVIGGTVIGTPGSGDHFGFESHQIGSFRAAGAAAPLTAATGEVIELSPMTGDVTIREV